MPRYVESQAGTSRAIANAGAGVFDQRCGRTGKLNLLTSNVTDSWRYTSIMKQESLNLPKPIALYFRAEKAGVEAVCQSFTENAVVKDEGRRHKGRAAIKQWQADTTKKYQYTSEPLACEEKDGKIIVTSRLTGNFAFSPVDLRFFFELDGDKIAALEIIP